VAARGRGGEELARHSPTVRLDAFGRSPDTICTEQVLRVL